MTVRKSRRLRPRRGHQGRASSRLLRPNGGTSAVSATSCVSIHSVEGLRRLSTLARRLWTIYGVAISAEGILRHQAAEQDVEIADCLRVGVCDPIADHARDLEVLIERSRARPPRSRS